MYNNDNCYGKIDFSPVKSDGFYLYNEKGEKIIDFSCNSGQISLLNSTSVIEKSIIEQLHRGILSQSELFYNKKAHELSKKLCDLAGFNHFSTTLFYNSISEANECAIKIARTRYNKLCERDYNEIICFEGSNHGNSISTLSASKTKSDFSPLLKGFKNAQVNNIFSVEKLISEHTCAIMIETVQYKNGIIACEKEFLQKLKKLCLKHEILLIFDETHCGLDRSGTFFAYSKYGIIPDIVTLSNFCGGYPLSACIVNEENIEFINNKEENTANGNALSFNIAEHVLQEMIKPDFLKNIEKISKMFEINLAIIAEKYTDVIQSVNVIGLMIGIKLRDNIKNYRLAEILLSNGLVVEITDDNDNEILLFPPLNINEDYAKKALKIILISIKEISIIESY